MAAAGTLLFLNYFVPICSLRLTLRLLASGPGKVLENSVVMEGLPYPAASSYSCLFGSHLVPGLYPYYAQNVSQIEAF